MLSGDLLSAARPYALALFQRAREAGTLDAWSAKLAVLSGIMDTPGMERVSTDPKISKDDLIGLFAVPLDDAIDGEANNLIRLLLENRRIGAISAIRQLYEEYRSQSEGVIAAEVVTAYPLSDFEIQSVSELIPKVFGGNSARLNIFVNASLIGGVVIKVGDRVIDASIRGKLNRLAQRLEN